MGQFRKGNIMEVKELSEKTGIKQKVIEEIIDLAKKYHVEKVILFGSRARGDNHDRSDIDLAVYGIREEDKSLFWYDIEELPTLLKFDIVHVDDNTDTDLLESIRKDGVVLYEKN